MGPVHAGMCRVESLKDGTLDLCDLGLMNDSLMVRKDNEILAEQRHRNRNV